MKDILAKLFNQQNLSEAEAKDLLVKITNGEANDAQIVAAISCLQMRNVSADELTGFKNALLELALPTKLNKNSIDVCGTGGDARNTFNISTLAAIVVAGAGYRVVKHGNYGVSSFCGSSTILEKMGYNFTNREDVLAEQLEKTDMCFLHAPLFHPALKRVAPLRQQLGIRTFFNFLGPLVNPAQPEFQLTGVYSLQVADLYRQVLSPDRKRFKVVHSLDGFDEISLTSPFRLISECSAETIYPEDLNLTFVDDRDLFGGRTIDEAQQIFTNVLSGIGTAVQNNVVLANAALGIQCFNPESSFEECFEEAKTSLLEGSAKDKFYQLIELSKN